MLTTALRTPTLLAVIGLSATILWTETATAGDVADIERRRLFEPTEAERRAETKGTIYIYDGLSDIDIQRALTEEFDRVEHMMFIRVRKTEADGTPKRDKETGAVEYVDDGC